MRYEPALSNPTAAGCQSGTRALAGAITSSYPELVTMRGPYGCFNRRKAAGTTRWSLHAEGRALDVGFTAETGRYAWALACELVARRTLYGTMRVILDRHIWSTEDPREWHRLRATSQQHLDHIHIEQFRAAAARPIGQADEYATALRASRP